MPTDLTGLIERVEKVRLTPAQARFLREAADNWIGVAKCRSTTGFARRAEREKAERLCRAGLMRRYVHGSDEYEITDAGRAFLRALQSQSTVSTTGGADV